MNQLQLAADLGDDAVLFAFAASVTFLVLYTLLARGYRSEIGQSLLVLDAALTITLGPSVLHRLFDIPNTGLFFAWYYVASIALVGAATWWRTWIIIAAQWHGRNEPPGS